MPVRHGDQIMSTKTKTKIGPLVSNSNLDIILNCSSFFLWIPLCKVFHHLLALDLYNFANASVNLHHMSLNRESTWTRQTSYRSLMKRKRKVSETNNATKCVYSSANCFSRKLKDENALQFSIFKKTIMLRNC